MKAYTLLVLMAPMAVVYSGDTFGYRFFLTPLSLISDALGLEVPSKLYYFDGLIWLLQREWLIHVKSECHLESTVLDMRLNNWSAVRIPDLGFSKV